MAGWSKLQDLLLQQSFLAAHSKTGQKISLCMRWVGCSHALNPDKMRKEDNVYSFSGLEFGVCLPTLQAWSIWGSSDLPVVLLEHHYMTGQVKLLAEANW